MQRARLRHVITKSRLVRNQHSLANSDFFDKANAFIPYSASNGSTGTVATIDPKAVRGPLYGKRISVKDNICTIDHPTTCASAILNGFRSPRDATLVELLRFAGSVISSKTNMDEFGMGSHSMNSPFGPVRNISSSGEEYSAGGSSGGSAVAAATSQSWASIGTDTGGSSRLPAAYTGIYGFKPSYGLISRNGVIAYANSLDTVGIMARSTIRISHLFDTLSKHDSRDPTSVSRSTRELIAKTISSLEIFDRPLRIGVPLEYNTQDLDPRIRSAWSQTLIALHKAGMKIQPVSLPSTKHALSAYYVLAPAEASSNLSRYDGIRYGDRADEPDVGTGTLYSNFRGSRFGAEVQRRILLGTYTLSSDAMDNYFKRAQKVRRLIQQDFDNAFTVPNVLIEGSHPNEKGVDILLCPTAPNLAPKLSELDSLSPTQSYTTDVMTVPASLAGIPSISIPLAQGQGPESNIGMQLIGQYGSDRLVLQVARLIEYMGLSKTTDDSKDSSVPSIGEYGPISPELAQSYMNLRRHFGGGMKLVQFSGSSLRKNE